MIAEGETSDVFYFDTWPTSPPSNLKCVSTSSNSLQLSWDDPTQGMEKITSYAFSYHLNKSKFLFGDIWHCMHTNTRQAGVLNLMSWFCLVLLSANDK